MAKGEGADTSFMPPFEIERPVAHVADRIAATGQLRATPPTSLVAEIAYLYDYLNFAHPFREGNGRTQREFFAQLRAESRHGLEWKRVEMTELHRAFHSARTAGDLSRLEHLFARILTEQARY